MLWGAYRGFRKGFLMEIISLVALILGIIGGFALLHQGMNWLDQNVDINGNLLPYVSFILIFLIIVIGLSLLGKLIKKILDMTLLGSIDSLTGGIIGVLKWAFGISVLLWLTTSFGLIIPEQTIEGSSLFGYIEPIAPVVVDYISTFFPFAQDLFESILKYIQPS